MGASSREFLRVRMSKNDFAQIPDEIRERCIIDSVDVEGEDYSFDAIWNDLKVKSTKAYKDLKNREYDLRHKNK